MSLKLLLFLAVFGLFAVSVQAGIVNYPADEVTIWNVTASGLDDIKNNKEVLNVNPNVTSVTIGGVATNVLIFDGGGTSYFYNLSANVAPKVDCANNDCSIAFWRRDDSPATQKSVFGVTPGTDGNGYAENTYHSQDGWYVAGSGNQLLVTSDLTGYEWQHIIMVKNSTGLFIFTNGRLNNSVTYSTSTGTGNDELVIGAAGRNNQASYTNLYKYYGGVTCIRYFNASVNQTIVEKLYNSGVVDCRPLSEIGTTPAVFSISTIANNASITTKTGDTVNWTAIFSSSLPDTIWFTHNDSGSFVNETVMKFSSSPFTFSGNVTITASSPKYVCGFLGMNDTGGQVVTSDLSCFNVADINAPTWTAATNNASATVINDYINWSVNLADDTDLQFAVFSENSTGAWSNDTPIKISGLSRALNVSHSELVTPGLTVCGRFYFNDTFGNQNMSQSCYTAPNLYRFNLTLKARSGNTLAAWANLSNLSGTILYNGSSSGSILFHAAPQVYNITLNTTSFGSVTFLYNLSTNANVTAYLPNITYLQTYTDLVSTQIVTLILGASEIDDYQYSNVQLIFNGTNYSTTRSSGTGGVNYSTTFTIPALTDAVPSMPYFWNYTIRGVVNSTEARSVYINAPSIVNCSPGSSNMSINFSIFSEESPLVPLVSYVEVEFNLGNNKDRGLKNLSYTLNGSSSYAFCIGNASFQADAYFKYYNTGGFTHRYYFLNQSLTNTTKYFTAYNFQDTTGKTALKFNIRDENTFAYLPNVVVSLERRYTGEGLWRVVQMDKSGAFGENNFNIIEKTADYRFVLRDVDNKLLKQTDTAKIICTSTPCELTVLANLQTVVSTTVQLGFSYVYDAATRFITMSWVDPTSNADSVRVRVSKETFSRSIMICDQTITGASGSATCNMSVYPPPYHIAAITEASPPIFSYAGDVGDPINTTAIRNYMGGVQNSAFIIGLTTILTGVAGVTMGVTASVAMLFVGLLAGFFMGALQMLTLPVLITLGIVTIFIAIKLRGRLQ